MLAAIHFRWILGAMRKRRYVVLVIAIVVVAGVVLFLRAPREPRYEGKPLSYWLKGYDPLLATETSRQQADKAIEETGTNAIPTLLKMLEARDSKLKLKLAAVAQWLHLTKRDFRDAERQQERSSFAFGALGGQARSAVPSLAAIYERNTSPSSRYRVLWTLRTLGPTARDAGPFLARWIVNHDYPDVPTILSTWQTIIPRPAVAVPALIKVLNDPSPDLRHWSVSMLLTFYKSDAESALPVLDNLRQHDRDSGVRDAAGRTYQLIVAEAAKIPK